MKAVTSNSVDWCILRPVALETHSSDSRGPGPGPMGSKPRSGRPPSIEDVASAAAVSTATVSRYLNSPELVADATAARIQKVIADLGYRPNRFAQGLMTRRSHVVGIVLPDIHGEFYSELLRGASSEARVRGYHLLVAGADVSAEGPDAVRSGPFGLTDGVAVMLTEPNEALWRAAEATGLPMVALDADPGVEGVASILIDNTSGASEAMSHLLASTPPSRCYYVGGPADNYDAKQRAAAFEACLRRAHHQPRPDQIVFGQYSPEWGRSWASTHLKSAPGHHAQRAPLAVLAGNDEIALGVLDVLQDAGLHVPRDARVVGFDDSRLASLLRPSLSSVRIPRAEVGAAAVSALIERIENPESRVISRTLPTRLVVRDSSRA